MEKNLTPPPDLIKWDPEAPDSLPGLNGSPPRDQRPRMVLSHFSRRQLVGLNDRDYGQIIARKPAGFWLSDESEENSWTAYLDVASNGDPYYCRRDFSIDLFEVRVIRTEGQMFGFNLEYGTLSVTRINRSRVDSHPVVDWPRVAQSYKGIIISPHQHGYSGQDDLNWYGGWDCACGCIWDLTCMRPVQD